MKKYTTPDTGEIILSLESNFVASSHYIQSPCVGCLDKEYMRCRTCANYVNSNYYKED